MASVGSRSPPRQRAASALRTTGATRCSPHRRPRLGRALRRARVSPRRCRSGCKSWRASVSPSWSAAPPDGPVDVTSDQALGCRCTAARTDPVGRASARRRANAGHLLDRRRGLGRDRAGLVPDLVGSVPADSGGSDRHHAGSSYLDSGLLRPPLGPTAAQAAPRSSTSAARISAAASSARNTADGW